MTMTSVNDIMDNTKILQLITERLENVNLNKNVDNWEMNHELIGLILELYNDDEDFVYEKMRKFSIEDILNYLQATHQYYLEKKLPEIEQSMLHIYSKYTESHRLLSSLMVFFNDYKNQLIAHIRMEERYLFPYIRRMIIASKTKTICAKNLSIDPFFSIKKFIASHLPIEDELKEVSRIIRQFSGNEAIPLPFKIFMNQVDLFEIELRKHAIIEDHVLVPMVIELENRLKV
jgi:regulator of cell morphogenesis and NO signaling